MALLCFCFSRPTQGVDHKIGTCRVTCNDFLYLFALQKGNLRSLPTLFAKHSCSLHPCLNWLLYVCMLMAQLYHCIFVSSQHNVRCNNTKIQQYRWKSSMSEKLLLRAQDYCPLPKWQTPNTVRVIRVIAKPTTWKTAPVLVAEVESCHRPKTLEKMFV